MDYVPHTEREFEQMLAEIGVKSFDELLASIPEELRKFEMKLPPGMVESDVKSLLTGMARQNTPVTQYDSYLGAGAYEHFIPSVVGHLAGRSEFYTAYTPYQAEASQGSLQAMFEYQTAICELTGMEISNASLYDAGSAVAEAAIASLRVARNGRNIVVSKAVHPEHRRILNTYMKGMGIEVREVAFNGGLTNMNALDTAITDETAGVIMQSPNFFGCIEDMEAASAITHKKGASFVAVVNPITLGILIPPGEYNADIAVGDGQPLGIPLSYGGPYLGFFACNDKILRKIPGRLIGLAKDRNGRRGFVMTLQAREQHIRRDKATSNICTNQALMAIRALIFLCCLGKEGIREVGEINVRNSHYASEKISSLHNLKNKYNAPFFNEFVVQSEMPIEELNERLLENNIFGGVPLGWWYPEMKDCMLMCVTEMKTKEKIDRFIKIMEEINCPAN
jgi:glycine dehydrogenase subunit 1